MPLLATLLAGFALGGGCTGTATEGLVHSFAANLSAGRPARAERAWAPAGRFVWYSTLAPGERLRDAAYDRSTLGPYFRARARHHERLRIVRVRGGYDPRRRLVDFGGVLVRTADDMRPRRLDFKGAADCLSGGPKLIVWSM